jgi:hypothetical protein
MPHPINLDILEVTRPCPADWNLMAGDQRVRFCEQCSLHVYNISEMDRKTAEQLLAEHEGQLCIRMYKRLDGTVITADCGGGWRAVTRARGRISACAGAVVVLLAAMIGCEPPQTKSNYMLGGVSAPSPEQIAAANAATEKANQSLSSANEQRVLTGFVVAQPATQHTSQK